MSNVRINSTTWHSSTLRSPHTHTHTRLSLLFCHFWCDIAFGFRWLAADVFEQRVGSYWNSFSFCIYIWHPNANGSCWAHRPEIFIQENPHDKQSVMAWHGQTIDRWVSQDRADSRNNLYASTVWCYYCFLWCDAVWSPSTGNTKFTE